MARRAYRSGSLFQQADGRWVFARSLVIDGRRSRVSVSGATPEEALSKAAARTDWTPNESYRRTVAARERATLRAQRRELHAADFATGRARRERALDYAERVIFMGPDRGWPDRKIAEVLLAMLTPRRVRQGVFGPCAYCGTWLATEVDHIIPTVRGGTNEPSNLASACSICNARKRDRTPEEWVA